MSKIALAHTVNPVIPIAGIPIKSYVNTYIATKLNYKCRLRALYRLIKCQGDIETSIKNSKHSISTYINSYLNTIFAELLGSCVEGVLDIECDYKVPDIVLFVIGTTDALFNILKPKRIEYDDYLQALAVLDNKFWSIEPTYITSLRCAYVYQGTCICRNIQEIVKFKALNIDVEYVASINCSNNVCLELQSPFDNPSTLYILKLTSHVISRVAQDILSSGFVSGSTISHLNLLYSTETAMVLEALDQGLKLEFFSPPKPITDITSIKFYIITLKKNTE